MSEIGHRLSYQNDHDIAPLATAGTIISASTPLRRPTPSILRHSTSISQINQRSFQAPKRRNSHHIDARLLDSLREVSENLADSTPTAARRRLQDKTVDASGPSDVSDKVGDSVATIRILLDEMDRILMQKELLLSTKTEEVSLNYDSAYARRGKHWKGFTNEERRVTCTRSHIDV